MQTPYFPCLRERESAGPEDLSKLLHLRIIPNILGMTNIPGILNLVPPGLWVGRNERPCPESIHSLNPDL